MDRHDYWYYSRHINNGSSCPWELGFRLVWIRVREEERGGVMEGGMDTCVKAFVKSLSLSLLSRLADSVEAIFRSLGMPNPKLTLAQTKTSSVRWMQRIVRILLLLLFCMRFQSCTHTCTVHLHVHV